MICNYTGLDKQFLFCLWGRGCCHDSVSHLWQLLESGPHLKNCNTGPTFGFADRLKGGAVFSNEISLYHKLVI